MNSKRAYQVLSAIHGLREVDGELPDDVAKNLSALESSLKSNLPGEKSDEKSSDDSADKPKSDDGSDTGDSKANTFEEAGQKTRERMKAKE